jgi:hypothetical protein
VSLRRETARRAPDTSTVEPPASEPVGKAVIKPSAPVHRRLQHGQQPELQDSVSPSLEGRDHCRDKAHSRPTESAGVAGDGRWRLQRIARGQHGKVNSCLTDQSLAGLPPSRSWERIPGHPGVGAGAGTTWYERSSTTAVEAAARRSTG